MPSKHTFLIKPISRLLDRYVTNPKRWAEPFHGFHGRATHWTNDLNPDTKAVYHLDAHEFCRDIVKPGMDGALFDPPYSNRQIVESYKSFGLEVTQQTTQASWFSRLKDALAPKIKLGGHAICFGWTSQGFGKSRGFELLEVLLVAHGGMHNDTIVTVEKKIEEIEIEQHRPEQKKTLRDFGGPLFDF